MLLSKCRNLAKRRERSAVNSGLWRTGVWAREIHSTASGFPGPESPYSNRNLLSSGPRHHLSHFVRLQMILGFLPSFSWDFLQPVWHFSAHSLSLRSQESRKPPPTACIQNFLNLLQCGKLVVLVFGRQRQLSPGVWGHLGQHRKPFVSMNNFIISWQTSYFLVGNLISSPRLTVVGLCKLPPYLCLFILSSFMQVRELPRALHPDLEYLRQVVYGKNQG